jgi:serine/threonine protein kinase
MHEAADPISAVATAESSRSDAASIFAELRPDLEVVRSLGRGSTSDVYLMREKALQRLVAVKVLRADLVADVVVRKRFEREAQSAARVRHPHVVGVHRTGWVRNTVPYIVMEYVEGRTVADIVDGRGPFAIAEARALLESVASALAAAHDHGIVHRDVRPNNIYVENRTGRAVLGDFGIAARLESGTDSSTRLTAVGIRLGETRYMSPEQLHGDPVTEQSDVYSFGLLAYTVLTGRGPFEATTDAEYIVAHMTQQPKPLRMLRPDLNAPWLPLLEHCLAKDPNHRPRARELANAFAAAAHAPATSGGVHEDLGPLGPFLEEMKRRRLYQVMAGYGAFTAAVFGAAQVLASAWDVPKTVYQGVILVTLIGFPFALVFGWVYDVSGRGIQRTHATAATRRARTFIWVGLGLSVALAAVVAWLLLGR